MTCGNGVSRKRRGNGLQEAGELLALLLNREKVKVKVTQSGPTLRILQARILKWVAFPFSRGSSQLRDQTQVSHIAGRFFTS